MNNTSWAEVFSQELECKRCIINKFTKDITSGGHRIRNIIRCCAMNAVQAECFIYNHYQILHIEKFILDQNTSRIDILNLLKSLENSALVNAIGMLESTNNDIDVVASRCAEKELWEFSIHLQELVNNDDLWKKYIREVQHDKDGEQEF